VTAITDLGGTYPIFYAHGTAGLTSPKLATRLHDLRPIVAGNIAASALYFFAARGGVGFDPMYGGASTVPPGTVMQWRDGRASPRSYVAWSEYLQETPVSDVDAQDRFLEISERYLRPLLRGHRRVACLMSSGTDSALMAAVLKRIGVDFVCLTA